MRVLVSEDNLMALYTVKEGIVSECGELGVGVEAGEVVEQADKYVESQFKGLYPIPKAFLR